MREHAVRAPVTLGVKTRAGFQEDSLRALESLGDEPGGLLVIDLRDTRNIDSTGLSTLVLVQLRAAERRHAVVLRGASEEVRFLLLMTGLEDRFSIEGGTGAAP
jgi:anti-anti-sigma factor